MVRLHALESVDEHGASLAVDGTIRSGDRALGDTPGPENVAHGTPRVGRVGAEKCCARGANLETRRCPLDGHVDDRSFIVQRLDCIRVSICRKLDGAIGGVEAGLVLAELGVVEGRRAPEVGLGSIQGEDLGVELASRADATVASSGQYETPGFRERRIDGGWWHGESLRNVRVDNLGKSELATVRHEVEALRLDASRLHGGPFQVISGGYGIGSGLGLLGDRLDGLGAIDRLLGTGNIGQPRNKLLENCVQRMVHEWVWGAWGILTPLAPT